jgi:hypothetical protein
MSQNTCIPNSFQTPNFFIDRLMGLLESDEYVVLAFATRHIFGWKDSIDSRQSRISLTMFEKGYEDSRGNIYGGCGLSRPKIQSALKELVAYGVIIPLGDPTKKGQAWQLPTDDYDIDYRGLEQRREMQQKKNRRRILGASQASAEKRKKADIGPIGTTAVPTANQYDSRTATGTTAVPITGTTAVQNQTHIQTHDQTQSESTTVDSKAAPSNEGQPGAHSEIIEQWGYRVGQIAYWWYKEGQKWVPGKIIRFTPNYAYFETKDKQGNIHIKWRGINGCSPDGSTDDWFQLVDLKPLQQVIARYSFKVTFEQRISADLNTRINMVYSELTGRWQNGSSVTPVELEAAYNWQAQEGGITPTMPVAVGTMLGKYRAVKLPSGKQSQRKFIHVPGCEMCTDGMVIDQDGKSQQCPNCLALSESDELKKVA